MAKTEWLLNASVIGLVLSCLVLGWYVHSMVSDFGSINLETPFSEGFFIAKEINSPSDHIASEQINVYNNQIILDIENARWAELADTNSMDPLFDKGANTIEISPAGTDEIKAGDIISFEADGFSGKIIHRVVSVGSDEEGWYCITKGDNLSEPDPWKTRFGQISGVLVGILY